MAQPSQFLDSCGGDRIHTSDAWPEVLGAIIGDGVGAIGNERAVAEASPPAMSVRVNTGKALIQGHYFEVYTGQETFATAAGHPTGADRPSRRLPRPRRANRGPRDAAGHARREPTTPALTRARRASGSSPDIGFGGAGHGVHRRRGYHRRARRSVPCAAVSLGIQPSKAKRQLADLRARSGLSSSYTSAAPKAGSLCRVTTQPRSIKTKCLRLKRAVDERRDSANRAAEAAFLDSVQS